MTAVVGNAFNPYLFTAYHMQIKIPVRRLNCKTL